MNLSDSPKKVLFIAPCFYNYENEIAHELERQGCKIIMVSYSWGKYRLPWKVNKLKRGINEQRSLILNLIDENEFDILFVIKGEILDRNIVNLFKYRNPNSKTINYQWDSITNLPFDIDFITTFDFKYTFDHLDSIKYNSYNLEFKPLFYLDTFKDLSEPVLVYDMATIGGMQAIRVKIIKSLQKALPRFKYKILLRTSITLNLPFNLIQFGLVSFFRFALIKDLNKQEIFNILKRSKAIIDIPQANQSGLSMRTIEVLGLRRKLITTNPNIIYYDFFNPNNNFIIDQSDINTLEYFMNQPYRSINSEIVEKYSLRNWVYTILNNKNESYLTKTK